jgi:hypothetical protein
MVDMIGKSSNPLKSYMSEWAEFFELNPAEVNYVHKRGLSESKFLGKTHN